MADESFTFEVKGDATSANRVISGVETGLDRIDAKAQKASRSMAGAFSDKNGNLRDANGRFVLMGKGADAAGRSIKGAGDAADRAAQQAVKASQGFGGIGAAVRDLAIAAGALAAGKQVFDLAEGYASLSNRLRLVATDSNNLNGLLAETKRIAQETRSDWQSTAEGTVRMTMATKDLGLSQREVLDFMERLNKTIIVSGASSTEASGGIIQLSQGLAAGALRGDELRSVMENLPGVADVIAKSMGKTRGELRKMGAEGKITAEVMIEAFKKQSDEIDANFGKTVPTVTQMFQYLKNEAVDFFGKSGQGSGVMRALGGAIKWVADNLDVIGPALIGVVQVLGGFYIIEKIIVWVKALGFAIAANPLSSLLTMVAIGISLLRQFGDRINTHIKIWQNVEGAFVTVGDVLHVLWEDFKKLAVAIYDFIEGAWQALMGAFGDGLDSAGIELSFENVLIFLASFVDAGIALAKFLAHSFSTIFGGIPLAIGEQFIKLAQLLATVAEKIVNFFIASFEKLVNTLADMNRSWVGDVLGTSKIQKVVDKASPGGKAVANYGRVDFSFDNPLAGSFSDVKDKFAGDWKDAMKTSTARDYIGGVMSRARDYAATKSHDSPGDVGTEKGKAAAKMPDEKAIKAMQRLRREYDAIASQSNPMVEAQNKIAHAQDVVNRAVGAGIATWAEGEHVMSDLRERLKEALDPMGAWVDSMLTETAALGKTSEQREHDNRVLETQNSLRAKGLTLNDAQIAQIEHLITLQEERARQAEREEALLSTIQAPLKEYNDTVMAGEGLLAKGTITFEQYTDAIEKARIAYIETTPYAQSFQYGIESGLKALKDNIVDVASVVRTTLANAFNSVEQAITDLVTKGKADWSGMIQSMLADMTKLLFRQALIKGGQALGLLPAGVPGFAGGGSMIVGGSGGTDSQFIAMRASPGETITTTRPGQGGQASGAGNGDHRTPVIIKNITITDPNQAVAAMDTRRGQRLVLNTISASNKMIRSQVSRR